MEIQRTLTVVISSLTVIPVYILASRFFDKKYGLIGAILFVFEPKIIQSSLSGISDTLYIFLVTLSLALLFDTKIRIQHISFFVAALATLVRYEGVMLFVTISIIFFILQKKDRRLIKNYCIAVGIFILTLFPLLYARTSTSGNDGVIDSVISGGQMYVIEATSNHNDTIFGVLSYMKSGFENLFKFLGYIMIPYSIFLVLPGIYWFFKNKDHGKIFIIVSMIVLSIPALYAYSRGIQESRYLYVLYPLLAILSVFTIRMFQNKIGSVVIPIIISIVILSSIGFIEYKKSDYMHEREAFEIAKYVSSKTKVINEYYPESKYVRVTGMVDKFPILSSEVSFGPKLVTISENSLYDFIQNNRGFGLDNIIVDGRSNRPEFLNDVFYNEDKYSFLSKEFDSKELGYSYQVKIYKIDYAKFDNMILPKK
jgi:4-amino-4-deoxy-L-arabinose transferase-like glycosyltransferase